MLKKALLLLATLIAIACGGQTEPTCDAATAYRPVSAEGRESDWTMHLDGTSSPGGCYFAGEVKWSNGAGAERTTSTALEFDRFGRLVDAPQDLCPDGPCGPSWSLWTLWEPVR